jgi:DOPA 4,5-dioxygenase
MTSATAQIASFHAHVYYDEASFEQARALCERARDTFELEMGRLHQKPVGPHPMWSCQLAFKPALFGELIPWLSLNRDGLIVFVHPNTGDDLADHSRHVIWLGDSQVLNLSIFEG